MEKAYNPLEHDTKWQKFWESGDFSSPEAVEKHHKKPTGESYTIMMPPPNVTGVLHQGHALFLALQDGITRWRRMKGDAALYLPGTDHASIAVQMQVVKHLEKKGVNYKELGREKFLEECWAWVEHYRPRIYSQLKKMGASCDWSRVKFTLDESLNAAVTKAFCELYKKGLIYQDDKLVNWTPKGQTVLSDLEVVYEERQGFLWHIKYPLEEDPSKFVVVATTRPETMLGDTAVAVHPEDERYKDLVGKHIKLPIMGRKIPIIADDFVEKDFGSGVVKITPAHDPNDFECGQRHKLERINILNKDGSLVDFKETDAKAFSGLDRFKARKKIVEWLKENDFLVKEEKHVNRVGLSDRFGDVVEPFLSRQWFVKADVLAKKAHDLVKQGKIEIVPNEFANQYAHWMENMHEWCISRQLWWGHKIPAYYHKETGDVVVSENGNPDPALYIQDEDVLDTWFSSALWPFSTLGWPNKDAADFKKFYPTQILETGFDILFFWVARMIMMGAELTDQAPFSKVWLHPMVRDEKGKKMSKTYGNVIDPIEIAEKYGADTLRLTLHALCIQGRDIHLGHDRIEGYRNFLNKVWNASKFVLSKATEEKEINFEQLDLSSKWILSKFQETIQSMEKSWSQFKMQEAAETFYHFYWTCFCDWYVEASKLSQDTEKVAAVLFQVAEQSLRLLHPICPHVTEEIWHHFYPNKKEQSLSLESFPEYNSKHFCQNSINVFSFIQEFVGSLRSKRAELSIKPSQKIEVNLLGWDDKSIKLYQSELALIKKMAKVSKFHEIEEAQTAQYKGNEFSLMFVLDAKKENNLNFSFKASDYIDKEAEIEKLKAESKKITPYCIGLEKKLSNDTFVSKAPQSVVDAERKKLTQAQSRLKEIESQLKTFNS